MQRDPRPHSGRVSPLLFDRRDHELLRIVQDVVLREDIPGQRRRLAPYMHPHGIKEMAAQRALRIAHAVAHLLGSLEIGKAEDRLSALRMLRDEVLYTSRGSLRVNAARVLVEIMKNLIRSRGEDLATQLMLARDFRLVTSGRPRDVRAQLRRYHLIEMPEEWNQVSFDDHVHDVNTKGRKSATHLVMDAWIKGLRSLTVIYYSHVPVEAAKELLAAAEIMGIEVRVGIEFYVRLRDKFAKLIWVPRGFGNSRGFIDFLGLPAVQELMEEGREVGRYHEAYVLRLLARFNDEDRNVLSEELGIDLPPLSEAEFRAFVGAGQVSIHHLGRCILERMLPLMRRRVAELRERHAGATPEEAARIEALVGRMNHLGVYEIIERHLRRGESSLSPAPDMASEGEHVPSLLTLPAPRLLERLRELPPKANVVLNLSYLRAEDVLELLYSCGGGVTHLEILNLKNKSLGRELDAERILELQDALNTGNVIRLKRLIMAIVDDLSCAGDDEACAARRAALVDILYDIPTLQSFYSDKHLRSCIGSDSTGQSGRVPGMGLVVKETLPRWVQSRLTRDNPALCSLPISVQALRRETYLPKHASGRGMDAWLGLLRRIPGLRPLGFARRADWVLSDYRIAAEGGNICTVGGVQEEGHGFSLDGREAGAPSRAPDDAAAPSGTPALPRTEDRRRVPLSYMNTRLVITLKILLGFIPAFLTFYLGQSWWVLAWFGAPIWFAITGVRNIIQSVLGCGGVHRSSLVHWSSLVSWNRLADSLLYTGLSVPLLEYLVKVELLQRGMGVTVSSNALLLYTVVSLVNGLYLAGHNYLRGFPRTAIIGNLFRSLFAIPLSLLFNDAFGYLLLMAGVPGVDLILQKCAAIISKLASDTVAGILEGVVDKMEFLRMRFLDYEVKLHQVFDLYARLELLYPLEDVSALLESDKEFFRTVGFERGDLVQIAIVNALDLLYFWMYQPRARVVLKRLMRRMTREERRVFLLSHMVLFREREISQLFLDGLVGRDFSRALAFYLAYWNSYLDAVEHMAQIQPKDNGTGEGGEGERIFEGLSG
ncbi:hypothetical protein dsx2_0752 [Desulfovibrio sp. X2]|uniref:hypothetical protein n=1 Tax=Desulfovibrio sp. X2 TaxID=941449 RepID=UPI000358D96A|nr:hypothetical protein [Desulfovibrio sp. X2]EPR37406.1 hypothetical protein dsx2_0752 [Desulfovibrio sp. X2]